MKKQLATLSRSSSQQDIKQNALPAKLESLATLQSKIKHLQEIIQQKNVHIAQLENMKAIASETIKKQAEVNQILFNRLKAIAPDQVLTKEASSGSLKLEGIDNKKQVPTTTVANTVPKLEEKNRDDGFIIVIGVFSLLLTLVLLWKIFTQYSAKKNTQKAEKDIVTEEHKDTSSVSQHKEPLLST